MEMRKHKVLMVAVAAALMLTAAGCGDDDTSTTDAGNTKPDSGQDSGLIPVEDAGPPPTTEQCIAEAAKLGSMSPKATIECLCDKCLVQMTDCDADQGCVDIRACSDRTGCRGTACYLATPECAKIIDDTGGPTGLSTALAS